MTLLDQVQKVCHTFLVIFVILRTERQVVDMQADPSKTSREIGLLRREFFKRGNGFYLCAWRLKSPLSGVDKRATRLKAPFSP